MWIVQNRVTEKSTYQLVGSKGNREPSHESKPFVNFLGGIYIVLLIMCSIGIPYFSVIATSLIRLRGYGLTAGNFTFDHYIELFTDGIKAMRALGTSFMLASVSGLLVSLLGTLIVVAVKGDKKWKRRIESLALFPEMIPNIVLVIGMMLFWNKVYKVVPLYNTIYFMVLVYTVMFLPYSIQYVSSALMQVGDNLILAGKVSGAGRGYIFRKITLPLVMKGVVSGWMMTFIIVFRELVASSLIAPPNVLTVSTYIVREFEQGSVSTGMAMAVLCVLFTTTALILMNQLKERTKGVE